MHGQGDAGSGEPAGSHYFRVPPSSVPSLWQDGLTRKALEVLQGNDAVVALAVFGSSVQGAGDAWSDVDLLLVVEEDSVERFYPSIDWLHPFGDVYTYEQSAGEFTRVTRLCFTDLRRLDIVITTERALLQIDRWPSVGFWQGARVLFSRSERVSDALSRTYAAPRPSPQSPEEFEKWARAFWFRGIVATGKVVRNDMLIALHLALEMVQDCCVLGMMLRDRAEGTNVHHTGGIGNQFVEEMAGLSCPFTAVGILDMIAKCAEAFDRLALQRADGCGEGRHPLLQMVDRARKHVAGDP